MKTWCWRGDRFAPEEAIPVTDRGFRYGMAVFESVRIWRGMPLFLSEHLKRIRSACADRDFTIAGGALEAVQAVLAGAGVDGLARIYVTAGDGTLTSRFDECRIFLMIEERPDPVAAVCAVLATSEGHRPLFGGIKTANYWANADALRRAAAEGKDEALLFNHQAELISAAAANVFVIHRKEIRTPALACGARDGVVREWLIQHAAVKEGALFVEDLRSADEVLITSSWLGVRSVSQIGGRELPSRAFYCRLSVVYQEAIAELVSARAV